MKKITLLFVVVLTFSVLTHGQVAINTDGTNPDNSAMLDIKSTTKGMLVPRMNTAQRIAISSPAAGLLVYDSSTGSYWFYNGSAWSNLSATVSPGWSLTGNAGTTANDFIGTTDNVPLNFRVNNKKAGSIDPQTQSTFFGYQAGNSNTTGKYNTANGMYSLYYNTTGNSNTAVGFNSGLGSSGAAYNNTTSLGYFATATASKQVRIGNSSVTSIGGYAGWTNVSDSRFKENVKEDVPGLSFIARLRPVTYQLDREKINEFTGINESQNKILEKNPTAKFPMVEKYSAVTTGFIAQEVEMVAKSLGFDFSGVDAPKNEKDYYGLRYAEFVVPLVKAVQEMNEQNISQQKLMDELNIQNNSQQTLIEEMNLKINQFENLRLDEFENLKIENTDLKSRLDKLERLVLKPE